MATKGSSANITAEQHEVARKAAQQRKRRTPGDGKPEAQHTGAVVRGKHVVMDTPLSRVAEENKRAAEQRQFRLNQAELALQTTRVVKLHNGSPAQKMAIRVIDSFVDAVPGETISRTSVAVQTARLSMGSDTSIAAIKLGEKVARDALSEAFNLLKAAEQ